MSFMGSVVQFVGVLLRPVPSVVTRFMENGSVEKLLVSTDWPATKDLVARMAIEAAKGVIHLHRSDEQERPWKKHAWRGGRGVILHDTECRACVYSARTFARAVVVGCTRDAAKKATESHFLVEPFANRAMKILHSGSDGVVFL